MKIIDAHTGLLVHPGLVYVIRHAKVSPGSKPHTVSLPGDQHPSSTSSADWEKLNAGLLLLMKQDKVDSGFAPGSMDFRDIGGSSLTAWQMLQWERTGLFSARALLRITENGHVKDQWVPLIVRFMHPSFLFQWMAWVPS